MRWFLLASILISALWAKEYAVIANQRLPELTPTQIKAIFLKKMTHVNGLHLVPVNLHPEDPIRKGFEQHILHMSSARLRSYWNRSHYLGIRPPVSLHSEQSAELFISKIQGGITYIDVTHITQPVHIIYQWKVQE